MDAVHTTTRRGLVLMAAGALATAPLLACGACAPNKASGRDEADWSDDAVFFDALVAEEQSYILSAQLEDGSLLFRPQTDGDATIVPYFSSVAALGLLEGGPQETLPQRLAAVERYVTWYGDHLSGEGEGNPDGSIGDFDLELVDGVPCASTVEKPDSVDAYAALYLIVLAVYRQAGGSDAFLLGIQGEAIRIVRTLLDTVAKNGLSRVSPSNGTQYLMDNVEVLQALRYVDTLIGEVWEGCDSAWPALRDECAEAADAMAKAIERKLWNDEDFHWESGLDSEGEPLDWKGWDTFYPCATAQLYPIAFSYGTGDGERDGLRARIMYETFCYLYDWEHFDHFKSGDASFYWPVIAYVAALMDDGRRVCAYLECYREAVAANGRGWPLYVADAAWASRAAALMAARARG